MNTSMTSLILPNSNQTISIFQAFSCNVLGYIDFKTLSGSSSNGINIMVNDNNWSSSIVNHVLYDLDKIGWLSGTCTICGTNSTPDTSSGGYNGILAYNNLTGKSWQFY